MHHQDFKDLLNQTLLQYLKKNMDPCFHPQVRKNMGMQGNYLLEGNDKVVVNLTLSPGFSCPFTPVRPEPIRLSQFQQYPPPDLLCVIFQSNIEKDDHLL